MVIKCARACVATDGGYANSSCCSPSVFSRVKGRVGLNVAIVDGVTISCFRAAAAKTQRKKKKKNKK